MELVYYKDAKEKEIGVKHYDGNEFFPKVISEIHLEDLKKLKCREDDVFILTYPKSGSHWVFEIVHMLLSGNEDFNNGNKNQPEYIPIHLLEGLPSPRVMVSHLLPCYLPDDMMKGTGRCIHIDRNPKDLAVSYFHHLKTLGDIKLKGRYDGEWSDFLPLFVDGKVPVGSWFKYVTEWERVVKAKTCSMLYLRYEDMKKDLLNCVTQIAGFLGIQRDDQLIETVAQRCHFSTMKTKLGQTLPDELKGLTTHGGHFAYRKGEVGDWKNWFSVAEKQNFDSVFKERMVGSSLKFEYQ